MRDLLYPFFKYFLTITIAQSSIAKITLINSIKFFSLISLFGKRLKSK